MVIYVVLFKIDGCDSVRVFSDIDLACEFSRTIDGYKTMFIETVDRETVNAPKIEIVGKLCKDEGE